MTSSCRGRLGSLASSEGVAVVEKVASSEEGGRMPSVH